MELGTNSPIVLLTDFVESKPSADKDMQGSLAPLDRRRRLIFREIRRREIHAEAVLLIRHTESTRAHAARSASTNKLGYVAVAAMAILVRANEQAPISSKHLPCWTLVFYSRHSSSVSTYRTKLA